MVVASVTSLEHLDRTLANPASLRIIASRTTSCHYGAFCQNAVIRTPSMRGKTTSREHIDRKSQRANVMQSSLLQYISTYSNKSPPIALDGLDLSQHVSSLSNCVALGLSEHPIFSFFNPLSLVLGLTNLLLLVVVY